MLWVIMPSSILHVHMKTDTDFIKRMCNKQDSDHLLFFCLLPSRHDLLIYKKTAHCKMYKDDISNMDPQNDLHIVYHCNF